MMQQKFDFYSAPDYSHGHRDWSNQDTKLSNLRCNTHGTLVAGTKGNLINIWTATGGTPHVDISHSHVMCLTFPTISDSSLTKARSKDELMLGRIDGSVAIIEVKDCIHYNRVELEHCKREGRFI